MPTSAKTPATITVDGHRLALDIVGRTIGVRPTRRATKACGHLEPEGRDGGGAARQLRAAVVDACTALARKVGAVQVEIYACSSKSGAWLANVECVEG